MLQADKLRGCFIRVIYLFGLVDHDLADRKEINLSMISSFHYCNGVTLGGKSQKFTLINAWKFYLSNKKLVVV